MQEGTQFLTNEGQQKTIYFFNGDPLIPIYDKETKQLSTKTVVSDDLNRKNWFPANLWTTYRSW